MQAKLLINFRDLNESDFLVRAQLISSSLTGNVNFPLPWPGNTTPPATLAAQVTAYENAYNVAKNGDTVKIVLRVSARNTLMTSLKNNAPYLEVVAGGSIPLLQSTGYELRQDSNVHTTPGTLPAPEDFKVVRGALSGTFIISCSALHGAGSYKAQWCTSDPTVEANWSDAATFKNCSLNTLPGLTPGKMYSLRLCGIGANGPGAWSNFINLIAV